MLLGYGVFVQILAESPLARENIFSGESGVSMRHEPNIGAA
jgi:hypothetical protein